MEFVSEKLWLLCELDAYGGRPNFAIFDSEEVIGQPIKTNMHKGKTVKIRKGKITIQGKIIVISDDKEFLEKELKHYRKNNIGNQLASSNLDESPTKMKRRRTIHDASPQITQHQQISWMPHLQHQKERILTPSSSLQSLNSITTITTPPMTFDQQTQTDKKWSDDENIDTPNFIKLLNNIETILDNQRASQSETIELKRIVIDLSKQVQTLTALNLNEPNGKEIHHNYTKNEQQSSDMIIHNSSESHLNETADFKIDDAEIIYNDSNDHIVSDQGEEVIFTFENEDTNLSNSNNASVSFRESINNSNRTKPNVFKIEHVTKHIEKFKTKKVLKSLNLNSTLINSLNTSRSSLNNSRILNGSTSSLASNIINEWKDDSASEDYVVIGNNGTKVPKYVMSKINWGSHTNATRGLLMSLFSRETLSTHSLTGKPSPAFMDRKKPAKEQLDAKIVTDIIQFVTTQCNVPESVVRNAITTKCADENKMSRQKRNSLIKAEPDFNKENATI